MSYDHKEIEEKWQKRWSESQVFRTLDNSDKPKSYVLDMFPYPSGEGLHVGHPKGYIATDVYSRFKRMNGYNVLHPMGWDAFGLPAENYALKNKVHPRVAVEKNIATFKEQLSHIGFDYDWSREINTTDPKFYIWTQWIFLQMFKKGLAYQSNEPINWCPSCMTGLANEDLDGNVCERCGTEVVKKSLPQWVLKITQYADRMLSDLDTLQWPDYIKEAQRNWIGKSEGVEIIWEIVTKEGSSMGSTISTFTTRTDTIPGVTFLVLAPESDYVQKTVVPGQRESIDAYVAKTLSKTEIERQTSKEKSGTFTGSYAKNPFTEAIVPIYLADYVLAGYGTGAVMGMPGHDARDREFATLFNLPTLFTTNIPEGITDKDIYSGEGKQINTGEEYDGLLNIEAGEKIFAHLKEKGKAHTRTLYRIQDWVFSRQRYWGEPIPIIHCPKDGAVGVPEDQLPVLLPEVESYEPSDTGESPLASIDSWVQTTCPQCGGPAKRETNTMPQWAGSSWYYLRFMDTHNDQSAVSAQLEKYWGPVDVYVGGDHAVRHLIYARFWHKFLFDIGLVSTQEPFARLEFLGFILAEDGRKMSKRYGNVINPNDVIAKYGADAFRVYEMFMGPFENTVAWSTASIEGTTRFIERVWKLAERLGESDADAVETLLNQTIKKVSNDIESFKFNTAVSHLMILMNAFEKKESISTRQYELFLQLLSPFAPHVTDELWERLGKTDSVHVSKWPSPDENKLQAPLVSIGVQVNGKVRGTVTLSPEATKEEALALAKTDPGIARWLEQGRVEKEVYVPGRIISFVVI